MSRRALLATAACCLLPLAGCGGGGGATAGAESFDDVLRGLKSAAASKKTYDAVRYADDLERRERAVINAFCNVATQLANNNETLSEQQFFDSVNGQAQSALGEYGSRPVTSLVAKLRATYDLAAINGRAAQLYANACFR